MRRIRPLMDIGVALALLTRLPVPRLPDGAFDGQARAAWAFPLVGLVVGLLAGGAGLAGLAIGLPAGVAAGLVLVAQVMATGAMHEDGLADTADGLWGGMTPERRLEIMRDSRVGTYGLLALVLSVGLRWQALAVLLPMGIVPLILAEVVSRAMVTVLMTALPHARKDGLARHVGRPPAWPVGLALGLAAVVTAGLGGVAALAWALIGPGLLVAPLLGRLAMHRLGGQTGDILGATQQLTALAVLLGALIEA